VNNFLDDERTKEFSIFGEFLILVSKRQLYDFSLTHSDFLLYLSTLKYLNEITEKRWILSLSSSRYQDHD